MSISWLAVLGGMLTIASAPDRGTRVTLTVPTFGAQVAT